MIVNVSALTIRDAATGNVFDAASGSDQALDRFGDQLIESIKSAQHTCSLDVSDAGPSKTTTVARLLYLSRERVLQLDKQGMRRALNNVSALSGSR